MEIEKKTVMIVVLLWCAKKISHITQATNIVGKWLDKPQVIKQSWDIHQMEVDSWENERTDGALSSML